MHPHDLPSVSVDAVPADALLLDVREVSFHDRAFQYCPTCQTEGRELADRRMSKLLK